MSRVIDADKIRQKLNPDDWGTPDERWRPEREFGELIDNAPTVDLWHYPARGELPDKDWSKHPKNISKECFVLTKRGVGLIARWDNDCETWFEKATYFSVMEVIAWQYFVPPKEEA